MSTVVEQAKLQGETITLEFDMLSRLAIGETVQTAICGVEVFMGTDSAPENILSGAADVQTPRVTQQITGGEDGVIYKVTCAVRTSLNNILLNQAKIAVLPSSTLDPGV